MPNNPAGVPGAKLLWESINAMTGWLFVGAYLKLLAHWEGPAMALAVGIALVLLVAYRLDRADFGSEEAKQGGRTT